jgi:iron complex transport system substrate-binding protein
VGTNAASSSGTAGSATSFPVSVHGAGGVTALTHAPQRIVSLSPTSTEDLYAVGAGSQVVAVDEKSDYPAGAPRTKLSAYQPNVEAIAAYAPDLVVITDESPSFLAPDLRKLHIPVLLDPAARTLGQAYAQIAELGLATGHLAQARALVASMRAHIAASVGSTSGAGRGLSVYDEIESNYYAAGSKTFVGQLLALFGLHNVADQAPDPAGLGYPQLSAEYLVTADPDIVLLSDSYCCHQDAATVTRRPGWSHMTAVRKHTVVPLNEDIASRWGPRTAVLTAKIAEAIKRARAAGV